MIFLIISRVDILCLADDDREGKCNVNSTGSKALDDALLLKFPFQSKPNRFPSDLFLTELF